MVGVVVVARALKFVEGTLYVFFFHEELYSRQKAGPRKPVLQSLEGHKFGMLSSKRGWNRCTIAFIL